MVSTDVTYASSTRCSAEGCCAPHSSTRCARRWRPTRRAWALRDGAVVADPLVRVKVWATVAGFPAQPPYCGSDDGEHGLTLAYVPSTANGAPEFLASEALIDEVFCGNVGLGPCAG